MIRHLLPASAVLLLAHSVAAQDPLPPNEPLTFALQPGEEKELTYIATVDGEASVWARSEHLDVAIELRGKDGHLVGNDEDSGGGTAAHLSLSVAKGAEYVVTVNTRSTRDEVGRDDPLDVTCAAFEAPIDEVTRALMDQIRMATAAMQALIESEDYEEARHLGRREITAIDSNDRWPSSLLHAVVELAGHAYQAQDFDTARSCLLKALTVRERTLPPEHPELQTTYLDLAATLFNLGDLTGARELEEKVLAVRRRTLPADHADLQWARLNLASTLSQMGDFASARVLEEDAVAALQRERPADDPELQTARENLSVTLFELGEDRAAVELLKKRIAISESSLPLDHPDLQTARLNVAVTLSEFGEHVAARELREQAFAARTRTLHPDDPGVVAARLSLLATLSVLGDFQAMREIQEKVLARYEQDPPADHLDLQIARGNLALTHDKLGDFARARELHEQTVAVLEEILAPEHPTLQTARSNLAVTLVHIGEFVEARGLQLQVLAIAEGSLEPDDLALQEARGRLAMTLFHLGELVEARKLQEQALAVVVRTLDTDHPSRLTALANLAATLSALGDLDEARRIEERVLAIRERKLPTDHPDLLRARGNLAVTLSYLGDLAGARKLEEQVLAGRERTLPEDHRDLQIARLNLAGTLCDLADLAGAYALEQQALGVLEVTLPEDHPLLLKALNSFAVTLSDLEEFARAREIQERVLAVYEEIYPVDHPEVLGVRGNLAATLRSMGDHEGARTLQEQVLETLESSLKPDDPRIQNARGQLALTLARLDDFAGALNLQEHVVAAFERTFPAAHPDLHMARDNVAVTLATLTAISPDEYRDRLIEHLADFMRRTNEAIDGSIALSSDRQIALRNATTRDVLSRVHSAARVATFDFDDILELTERLRGQPSRARRLVRLHGLAADETLRALSSEVVLRRAALAAFLSAPEARAGEALANGLAESVRALEHAEALLTKELATRPESAELIRSISVEELATSLPSNAAAVCYHEYSRLFTTKNERGRISRRTERHLVAMVLRRSGTVTRIELGPLDPIKKYIGVWRGLVDRPLGSRIEVRAEVGARLRGLLLDPILDDLRGETRLVVTLTENMHLLPLDALPIDDGRRVGDVHEIDVVGCLEWLVRKPAGALNDAGFLAFGSADYARESEPMADEVEPSPRSRGNTDWLRDFRALPFSEVEVKTILRTYESAFANAADFVQPHTFTGRAVDKARLRRFAPRARWLHLATHGWFAPESIPSILDRRELKSLASPIVTDFRDHVRGYLPLELCGLALAGANLPPNDDGTHPALLSGRELADIDLTGVELAVLSACDSNVGDRRAGQGIMSLQEALATAGVRYSLTSLWDVPDEAAMTLMTRFYEGIWHRGETKREALWNAKRELRDAEDPRTGKPRYGLEDWAGWVLYGNPE